MYQLAKFGSHRSDGNGDANSYIGSCTNSLYKAELTTWIRHIERFSKLEIPNYNSKVSGTVDRKTRKIRREGVTQAIVERYAIHSKAIKKTWISLKRKWTKTLFSMLSYLRRVWYLRSSNSKLCLWQRTNLYSRDKKWQKFELGFFQQDKFV